MLGTSRTVEVTGSHDDPAIREPGDGVPARLTPGCPQVQSGLAVINPHAGTGQRGPQDVTPPAVTLTLLSHMLVITQRCDRRVLNRGRHHHSGVLAHGEQITHHLLITGHESEAVTRKVGTLGQGVHRQHSFVRVTAYRWMQDGDRLTFPAEFDVALVADHDDIVRARPCHDLGHALHGQHGARRVARRVQPHEGSAINRLGFVSGDGLAPGKNRTHRIGRIGDAWNDDAGSAVETQHARDGSNEFLGTDAWQNGSRMDVDPE